MLQIDRNIFADLFAANEGTVCTEVSNLHSLTFFFDRTVLAAQTLVVDADGAVSTSTYHRLILREDIGGKGLGVDQGHEGAPTVSIVQSHCLSFFQRHRSNVYS